MAACTRAALAPACVASLTMISSDRFFCCAKRASCIFQNAASPSSARTSSAASAAGSARWQDGYARLDPDLLSIVIDGVPVLVSGSPTGDEPELANGHCAIELDLALGGGEATYLTTDLSHEYVSINADYRS